MQLVCYINVQLSIVTESCSFVSALGSIKFPTIKSNEAVVCQYINSPLSKQQAAVGIPSSCFLTVEVSLELIFCMTYFLFHNSNSPAETSLAGM